MKKTKFLSALMLILLVLFLVQCEKYDYPAKDSQDKENTDYLKKGGKDGSKGNPDAGDVKGEDYGDLYELYRTDDGVPILTTIHGEYYVQPVGADGLPLQLNDEGELDDPTLATAVEFGRLNIVRSPPNVLDQAFNEAMKVLGATGAIISLDFCGRLTSTYPDPVTTEIIVKTIDSPRENMAIYKHIMNNMFTDRLSFLNGQFDPMMVAASCFAAGSDKTGTVNLDEVVYINGFMDCIGYLPPITNDDGKLFFNFSTCSNGSPFVYDRSVYEGRYIQFIVWENVYYPVDEDGYSEAPIFDIRTVMEGLADGQAKFTSVWPEGTVVEKVEGFAAAVDDAVQVLDLVHGDSNIRSVPYSEADNPADQ